MDHYDVVFLDDFRHVIKDVDTTVRTHARCILCCSSR
jgi:hypothetical protein